MNVQHLAIWLCQERNKTYYKVSFTFENFWTEQTMDSICQPQQLEANKTLFFLSFILRRITSFEVESQI